MDTHEIARIAAACNALRPDWPIRQLQTLLTDERMVNRPRRDVTVALAWVACESGTSSPYRVLETGPWWKAAGIEGAATNREPFDQSAFCRTCGKPEHRCRAQRIADDDHEFESVLAMRQRRERGEFDTSPRIVDELHGLVGPDGFTRLAPDKPDPTPNPHAQAAREAMRKESA